MGLFIEGEVFGAAIRKTGQMSFLPLPEIEPC